MIVGLKRRELAKMRRQTERIPELKYRTGRVGNKGCVTV